MQYGIPGGDVHHLAGHVVPLVAGHARQAGLDAVQAGGGRRDRRARRRSRPAATRWRRGSPARTWRAAASGSGVAQRKAAAYLAEATTPEALHAAWKEARVAIRHQANVEKGVIRSSRVLYVDPAGAAKGLAPIETSVDKTAAALTDSVRAAYALHAQRLNTPPVYEPPQTAEEKDAWNLIVECASGQATFSGCGGCAGGGRGAGPERAQGAPGGCAGVRARRAGAQAGGRGAASGPSLPQHMNAELSILLGKKLSALEIRDFLSGEFEPVPLADVMAVLRAREAAGTIKLVPRR